MTTVGLCIICHDRPDDLVRALASAGSGWDHVAVVDMASDPPLEPVPSAAWHRSDENLGVAAGRNLLAGLCPSDVLVFLDDDAIFLGSPIARLRERFDADPGLAVVAFKVSRPDGSRVSTEYPFRGRPRADVNPRACAYFVGCGYAVRRVALDAAGGYDNRFFYSTEEVDLAFRLLRDGWTLLYDPGIAIEHRPSPRGRSVAPRVPALLIRNRLIVARRYLPLPLAVVHCAAWTVRSLRAVMASRGLRAWLRGWSDGLSEPVDRQPLSWRRLWEIHRIGGRVLW